MAATDVHQLGKPDTTLSQPLTFDSYDTALCIIPSLEVCQRIDNLRLNYDKSYGKWPPHINILYPFVAPELLENAEYIIRSILGQTNSTGLTWPLSISMRKTRVFANRQNSILHLAPDVSSTASLQHLRSVLEDALSPLSRDRSNTTQYNAHLTVGQFASEDPLLDHIEAKANRLLPVTWPVRQLVVLTRARTNNSDSHATTMQLWKSINIVNEHQHVQDVSSLFLYENIPTKNKQSYYYEENMGTWTQPSQTIIHQYFAKNVAKVSMSTYNVLAEFIHPPSQARYPALVRSILSADADCDVLVLQEVTDDFLSFVLGNRDIRHKWHFVSHGSPERPDFGPMPSLCNIVVFSRFPFSWRLLPFAKKHKGVVLVQMDTIQCQGRPTANKREDCVPNNIPLIVACVHLTPGLNHRSVVAKETQIRTLLTHLRQNQPQNSWIVLGDFNIITSSVTVNTALESGLITSDTVKCLKSIESLMAQEQLNDAWYISRVLNKDMTAEDELVVYEGEEGATFNPLTNEMASETMEVVEKGWNNRPQRYDRILYKNDGILAVDDFCFFGFPTSLDPVDPGQPPTARLGSDHWGLRTTFSFDVENKEQTGDQNVSPEKQFQLLKASPSLYDSCALESFLERNQQIPSRIDRDQREEALQVLEIALTGEIINAHDEKPVPSRNASGVRLILVSVGSYRLGVWNSASDVDCLCIGAISSKVFFTIAKKRLRKTAQEGIKLVRTVKALSGTMMILKVRGIMIDLHYCPAAQVTDTWPKMMSAPLSDSMFDLPILSLKKLKPLQDDSYVLRTIPDLFSFRLAHRLIKLWAERRGLYAAKFGYLGGIHITMLLSNICKQLYEHAGSATALDLVRNFFKFYSEFDWAHNTVFDPFFHRGGPLYQRTAQEPMVILTPNRPVTNIARAATVQSVRTITRELQRADRLLSGANSTWSELIGTLSKESPNAEQEFLSRYPTYVKIDVNYWGTSLSKAGSLLAWLESRCVLLLVALSQNLPQIQARIWPKRFTSKSHGDDDVRDLHACYLVGLERLDTDSARETDRKVLQNNLLTRLSKFADQLRSNEAAFDKSTTYIDVAQVSQATVQGLRVDLSESVIDGLYDNPSDSEDDEEDDDDVEECEDTSHCVESLKTNKTDHLRAQTEPSVRSKLRPAGDVLSRLRWDPSLQSDDFIIGYEDRFVGVKEIALVLWKSEQTDEEFIPQHRIVYFKRISDGVRVWDRRGRVDLLFGKR